MPATEEAQHLRHPGLQAFMRSTDTPWHAHPQKPSPSVQNEMLRLTNTCYAGHHLPRCKISGTVLTERDGWPDTAGRADIKHVPVVVWCVVSQKLG